MRNNILPVRLFRLLSSLLLPLLLSGCHSHALNPASQQTGARIVVPALSVQESKKYQSAASQFARKDYSGALAQINLLLAKDQFRNSPSDHRFLLYQQAICRHAINPAIPAHPPISDPIATADSRLPRTIANADCGPRALLLVCRKFGVKVSLQDLRQQAGTTGAGTTMQGLVKAAKANGFQANGVQVDRQALAQMALPAIGWIDSNHYVAVFSVSEENATIHDPNKTQEEVISINELLGRTSGIFLTLSR